MKSMRVLDHDCEQTKAHGIPTAISSCSVHHLDIRRQQIILDAVLDAFNAGLEQRTCLKANPNAQHRSVARAYGLHE